VLVEEDREWKRNKGNGDLSEETYDIGELCLRD